MQEGTDPKLVNRATQFQWNNRETRENDSSATCSFQNSCHKPHSNEIPFNYDLVDENFIYSNQFFSRPNAFEDEQDLQ